MKNNLLSKKASSLLFWSLALLFLLVSGKGYSQVYQEDFGSSATVAVPYTSGTNATGGVIKNTNLTSPVWNQNLTSANFAGNTLGAMSATTGTSTYTLTCTFTVASGFKLTPTSIGLDNRGSATGPTTLSVSISGTGGSTTCSPTISRTAAFTTTAATNFASTTLNLTGAITLTFTLTGGASGSTERIDNIILNGTVTSTAVAPTITLANATKTYGDGGFTMTASSNSNGAISYSSNNSAVATITSGGAVTIVGAGTATITANQAAGTNGGSTNYTTGSATATVTVNKASGLTITANGVSKTYGATLSTGSSTAFSVSGLQYSDSLGTSPSVTVTYGTGGASTDSATLSTVSPAVYTGTAVPSALVAGSGATYSTNNYNAPSYVGGNITVSKANQSISFASTAAKSYGDADYTPGATSATSGTNAITFSTNGTTVATVVSNQVHIVGVGTTVITASQASNDNYNATSATQTLTVSPKNLTVSGLTANNKNYDGNTTASLSGTGSLVGVVGADDVTLAGTPSGTFASSAVGTNIAVTVTGYTLNGTSAGNYTLTQPTLSADIIANTPTVFTSGSLSAVNTTYGSASATPSSFSVSGQSLTDVITVAAPAGFEVSLSSGSGYASSITVGAAGNVSSTLVYVRLAATTAAGTYSGNVTVSSPSATSLTVATTSSTVAQKGLTISGLTGVDKTYDGTTAASVTGTASLVGVVGSDDVTLNGTAATYAFANANAGSGKAITVLGYTLNGTAVGNYTLAQPTGVTATINKADQTIAAISSSETRTFGDASYSVATTATSGLTVTYSSSVSGVATVALNGTVTIAGAGSTVITASQAGNANYNAAASVTQSLTVNKADQTLSAITASVSKTFGDAPYSAASTATSGLTVAYSSDNTGVAAVSTNGTVTIAGGGTATITASQAGNANYNAATSVTQVVTVAKADQTITLAATDAKTMATTTYTLPLNASSGLPISYSSPDTAVITISGNVVTIVGAGTATITASQAGNNNYNAAANATQVLTVTKLSQTITFNALINRTTADGTFNLTLNASSGLPITYTSSNTAVATISGNVVTILTSGTTTITASQAGNSVYDAATSVSQVQTILTPVAKWTFDAITLATAASATPNITAGSGVADVGVQPTGSLFSSTHASAATLWTTPAGNGSAKSATSDHWAIGDYYQFKVNTSNYHDLALSFDTTGSATGPNAFKVQYSLTGTGTFTDLPSGGYAITADSWSSSSAKTVSNKSFDLSSLTSLNNKSAIYIRLTCNSTTGISNTFGTGGTNRVDNFTVTGIACDAAPATITASGATTFCDGGSVTLTANAGESYLWSNGATSQSITVTTSGSFTVTVKSANGCLANSSATTVTVTPNTSHTTTISACDTYTWSVNGTTYSASGTYTSVTGCATEILNLTITPSSIHTTSITACDSYTWNGTTYTATGLYTGTTSNCVTEKLDLTITPSSIHTTTASACDSYTWNGTTYTASGLYTGTTTNCVTEKLDLTITPSSIHTTTISACDSYTWNGTTYSATGLYTGTTTNCVTEKLDLTITPSTTSESTQSACDSYTWNGDVLTASGDYTHVSGCNTETLHLTITPSTTSESTQSACDSYTWYGDVLTASGDYTHLSGCNTETLHLTITPSTTSDSSQTACDSYTWYGNLLTASGDYTHVTGCNTETLHLTITPSTTSESTQSACDSYTYYGDVLTASGDYTHVSGCNTETLHLTITPSTTSEITQSACDSYTWFGDVLTASGDYTHVTGCNTETLHLTITPSTTSESSHSACDSYTWYGDVLTASGDYTHVTGCNTETLHLTITPSTNNTTTLTVNASSYTWSVNGQTYSASGTYTSVSGCHTETLVLTLSPCTTTASSETVSACDTYTWSVNGQTYTTSGTYTHVTNLEGGCTDTKTLVLTINSSTSTSQTIAACDSYTWSAGNGNTYTASGTYTTVTTNHAGCPLTKTLVLTINASSTTEETVTACNNYTWAANSTNYTSSGDYFYSTTNPTTGCAIDKTLHLTITTSTSSSESITACSSYTWPVDGTTYTASGTYTHVGTNEAGCTDTKTLVLTINTPSITAQPAPTYICSAIGSTASVSVATTMPGATYQWQYRMVSAAFPDPTWLNITSSYAAVYSNYNTATLGILRATVSSPPVGTQYRVIITGDCGTLTSDAAPITILSAAKAGKITSAASVCLNGDITFTLSGYAGSSIQWQSSPLSTTAAPGVFTDIAGATSPVLTVTNASTTMDKSYRAVVFNSCNNTSVMTAVKTIKVDPTSVGGTATGGGTVCSSGGSGTLKLAGNVGKIQWEYSLDGGNTYASAPGAATASTVSGFSTSSTASTAATYLVTNITVPVQFRAKVTSGLCSSAYSNIVSYSLATSPFTGSISAATSDPLCPGTGTTLTISGNVGTPQWQKSTNGGSTWTNVVGTTTYNTGALAATASFRALVTIGGTCGSLPTNVVVVNVKLKPVAKALTMNTTSPTGVSTTMAICTNAAITKVLTIGAGYVGTIQWQSSTDGVNYSDISGQTGVSYTIVNPVAGANYFRAKFSNGCTEAIGAAKAIYYKDCGAKANDSVIVSPFDVVAYPNPYSGSFNLSLNTSSIEKVNYTVYDMTGRLIDQREVSADAVSGLQIGDHYPSGVYSIIVTQGKEVKTLRVIKR